MALNPIDLVTGLISAADVVKGSLVAWVKARVPQVLADVTELRNTTLAGQLIVKLKSTGADYRLDSTDTTTADDGAACILSADGLRFKRIGFYLAASNNLSDVADPNVALNSLAGVSYATAQGANASERSRARSNIGAFLTNFLINPSGVFQQAGLGSTADGAYCGFDQWLALTQANPVTSSQVVNAENGTPSMMRLTQANASAQRFGLIQWIENADCANLRGQNVVMSARARASASITLRYAIIEWTGTADTITKDVVNDWTSGTFTTGNFFNAASLVVAGAGSIALAANTLTDITALSATLSGSLNNVAVFFWTDAAQAQNATLDLAKVQLEEGIAPSAHVRPRQAIELMRCKRFFYKGTPPARGLCASTSTISRVGCPHPVPMRTAPTLTVNGSVGVTDGSVANTINAITNNYSTADTFEVDASVSAATLTANRVAMLYASSGTLSVDARL